MPDLDLSSISAAAGPLQTWVLPALLGLGLASATGLRTFLPLLMLALAAKFELFGVRLIDQMDWLVSWPAIAALGVAAVAEFAGDKVPAIDHGLNADRLCHPARSRARSRRAACSGTSIPSTAAIAGAHRRRPGGPGLQCGADGRAGGIDGDHRRAGQSAGLADRGRAGLRDRDRRLPGRRSSFRCC